MGVIVKRTKLRVTTLWCLASVSSPVLAQSSTPIADPPAQPRSATDGSADIIVTAQKREQSLQNVPISVTALTAETLRGAGVRDVKDLQVLTPGLNTNSSSNEVTTTVRIHGVGTVGENPGIESSVGIVIDGVYRPRNGVGFSDLGPLQRIEVLRGPQGTLFGKNTSAGVVNIITAQPSFTMGGAAELTAGNYGAIGGSVSLTGPLIEDRLAASLFVTRRKRDGFYDVRTGAGPRDQSEDANQNYWSARGQLLFRATPDVDLRLIGDYTRRRENCCSGVQTIDGATAAFIDQLSPDSGVARPVDPYARVSYTNRGTEQHITDRGVSAEVNWNLANIGAQVTSITAYRRWDGFTGTDLDFSSADILYRPYFYNGSTFKQFSQEVRFAGKSGPLNYLIGGFYANEHLYNATPNVFGRDYETYLSLLLSGGADPLRLSTLTGLAPGTIFPEGSGQRDQYHQTSNSLALFTNDTLKLLDGLEATGGLRYTHELKRVRSDYNNLPGDNGCAAVLTRTPAAATNGTVCLPWTDPSFANYTTFQRLSENEWTGTGKLAYHFNRDIMIYGSYARGYKAGGFNLDRARLSLGVPNPNTEIAPEIAKSWDAGLKTLWFNRKLSINIAAFRQRFTNFQLNVFTGISNIVVAVPKVKSKGVDVDFLWRTPLAGFTLQGGITYADTRYGQFTPTAGVPVLLPGNQLSFAPKWSGALAGSYLRNISDTLKVSFNLEAKYSSSYNTGSDLAPQKLQDAFTMVDGRVGLGAINDRWLLELWSKNLTQAHYKQVVIGGTLQTGTFDAFLGAPRTFGATLTTRF